MTHKPLIALALLALSGTVAFSQQPPPAPPTTDPASAAAPAPPAAPVERRPPSGPVMARSFYRGGGDFHSPGASALRGPRDGMGPGFHIVPPGMWWRDQAIVQKLTLTPDQTKKMDDIFQQSRIQLIDLKANVEKQDVMLEPLLSANPPDTAKAMAQIDKVAQARADLEKADARMLLGIRGVLTPDQWTKLQTHDGHGMRGPMGPGGPGGAGGPGGPNRAPRAGGGPGMGGENLVAPDLLF